MTAAVAVPARRAVAERVVPAGERPLPVLPALEPLFPPGGLRRGSAVAVRGSASLLLALLAGPSRAGAWCAVVGLPTLGLVAAAETGVALERLALVPDPGPDWAAVAGALLDAVDVVVVAPRGRVLDGEVRRLMARARQRGAVLVPYGAVRWPGAERRLSVTSGAWEGLDAGSGRLQARRVVVRGEGRGSAARARELRLWLPAPGGGVRPDTEPVTPLRVVPGTGSPSAAALPLLRAVPDLPRPPSQPGPDLPRPPSPPGPEVSRQGGRLHAVPATHPDPGSPDTDPHVPHGDRRSPGRRGTRPVGAGAGPRGAGPRGAGAGSGPGSGSAGPGSARRGAPERPGAPPPPRPRPAGHPVPAGRSAAVGGGGLPVPPPPVGAPARPGIPPEVLARLRPASTLPRPPHRAAQG